MSHSFSPRLRSRAHPSTPTLIRVRISLLQFCSHRRHRRSIGQTIGLTTHQAQHAAIFKTPIASPCASKSHCKHSKPRKTRSEFLELVNMRILLESSGKLIATEPE